MCRRPVDQVLALKRAGGNPVAPQTFEEGGEFCISADDGCIRHGLPFAHIVEMPGGDYVLCFVPLPNAIEDGMDWQILRFWVME